MAPPPGSPADPTRSFCLTRRLPNGTETILGTNTVSDINVLSEEQAVRAVATEAATQQRTNNPAWRLFLYGPTNGGYWTDDDRVWDSAVS
jgi:hypothetical protein